MTYDKKSFPPEGVTIPLNFDTLTEEEINEKAKRYWGRVSDVYLSTEKGSFMEKVVCLIRDLFFLWQRDNKSQNERIRKLEEGAKAHERQLRNIMPSRSDDI